MFITFFLNCDGLIVDIMTLIKINISYQNDINNNTDKFKIKNV